MIPVQLYVVSFNRDVSDIFRELKDMADGVGIGFFHAEEVAFSS